MAQKTRLAPAKKMTRAQLRTRALLLALLAAVCLVLVIPTYANRGIDWVNVHANIGIPNLPNKGFNLGLDLQGGAHLIYQAKVDTIAPADRASSVEGVRDVIERRLRGGLGVSEPLVQTTKVGEEYRIIVDLPGVASTTEAIKLIGETPILDFKEQNNAPPRKLTADEKKQMDAFNANANTKINAALKAIKGGLAFGDAVTKYSEDDATKVKGGDLGFITAETFPEQYAWAKDHKAGDVSGVVKSYNGLNILKFVEEKQGEKEVTASHILICYAGATGCTSTSTKEQVLARITELKKEVTPQNFEAMSKKYSTEPGAATSGGNLGSFTKGRMVPEFENAVWDAQSNTVIGPVETQFGYHLIFKRSEDFTKEYHLQRVFVKTQSETDIVPPTEPLKSTGLSGKQLKRAEVTTDQRTGQVQVSLQFDADGTKLFADITTRNVGKQVAIYLDNQPISTPTVNEPITSGDAVISGSFNYAEARTLSQRLNSGALPVPVEVISQEKIDATLGQDSLTKSFEAGFIGLILVMIFMVVYYRLPGFLSVISLAMYSVLNLAFFKIVGVTLTLAGIAGFILSIGMAVDANVLVFERLKEELKAGKSLLSAMEESFLRAWPSIRDGHVTTLISCILLMWFGSGFIQGFATVLATGTLVSLFTAITVTRTIMRLVFPWFGDKSNILFLGHSKVITQTTEDKQS